MQPTTMGHNRTGAALSPQGVKQMIEAVNDLSPQVPISTLSIDAERLRYISEADSVGSIPPPASLLKGSIKKAVAMVNGISPSLFMDKIGERIAFERSSTRVYDALISKYLALLEVSGNPLPAPMLDDDDDGSDTLAVGGLGEDPLDALRRIRSDEHSHFLMLCEVMTQLGGDPTAQTPCADVSATATMGVLQVVTDPRTTLAQCLNATLIAELTDNASWELLSELATRAGQPELADLFRSALSTEEEHLMMVRNWLRALTVDAVGSEAV